MDERDKSSGRSQPSAEDRGGEEVIESGAPPALSRRTFLQGAGLAAGALSAPRWLWLAGRGQGQLVESAGSLTGFRPLRVAMHVHGSWSEAVASWQAQFQQAAVNGFDVLYLTDHDFRAMALGYATSLAGVPWVVSSTGSLAQKTTDVSGGSIRLLAESASQTPATLAMSPAENFCRNRLRTSIAGTTLTQKVTSVKLSNGARYEIVIPLSYHPATAGRPAGQYRLVYRFGGSRARFTADGGLTGVVQAPRPYNGSAQVLDLAADVAAFWPDLVAIDNCLFGLSFVVTSPRRTAVADARIASVTFRRTESSADAVIDNQAKIVSAYQASYPSVTGYPETEISKYLPDMNTFGMAQWLPDYSQFSKVHDTLYRELVDKVHSLGGVVSWDHPFGYQQGPLLGPAEQRAKRREVFREMSSVGVFGVDILEVGYNLRGHVDLAAHLALWDTFSRDGTFLTGNGANDDHTGKNWRYVKNGFYTGIWAASRSNSELGAALRAGRVYTAHLGRYRNGEIDMLVDDSAPMGSVSVSTRNWRELRIYAANMPEGSSLQLVRGPVDYAGNVDPGSGIARRFAASELVDGEITIVVDCRRSRFYRVQVADSTGQVIGVGNPVWLLRSPPPGGIPAPRRSP